MLNQMGFGTLTEFRLTVPRRVDIIGLSDGGEFVIVEVKSSVEDFRADQKWRDYLPYCDMFYFAVPERFPSQILPRETGLIVADAFGAAVRRPAPIHAVNANRRRRQLHRFAMAASQRLQRISDPGL